MTKKCSSKKDLMRIGSNETIYTQFLKEKDRYTAEGFKWEEVLCPMCVKLHMRIVLRLYQTEILGFGMELSLNL